MVSSQQENCSGHYGASAANNELIEEDDVELPVGHEAVTAAYYERNGEIVDHVRTNDGLYARNIVEAMDRVPRASALRRDLLFSENARTSHQAKVALEMMTPVEFRTILLPRFLSTVQLTELGIERWILVHRDPDGREALATQQIKQRFVSTWGGYRVERHSGHVDEWDPDGDQKHRLNGTRYTRFRI